MSYMRAAAVLWFVLTEPLPYTDSNGAGCAAEVLTGLV